MVVEKKICQQGFIAHTYSLVGGFQDEITQCIDEYRMINVMMVQFDARSTTMEKIMMFSSKGTNQILAAKYLQKREKQIC